jgi:hypothetical protein
VILFECTPDGLKGANQSASEIYDDFTQRLGYRVFLIKDFTTGDAATEPLTQDAFRKSMVYPALARNYVAAPADRKPLGA